MSPKDRQECLSYRRRIRMTDRNVCPTGKRMSQQAATIPLKYAAPKAKSFVHHAKVISALTLASRVLGVLRESFAAKYFGAGLVSTAFTVAFTVPNLFRRLF